MELETYKSPPLIGVQYSPNTEARLLEDSLGIKFTEVPKKIELTRRNRIALVANGLLDPIQNSHLLKFIKRDSIYVATYHPSSHTFFAEIETDLHAGIHENMHGYLHGLSGNQHKNGFMLLPSNTQSSIHIDKPIDLSSYITSYANYYFSEGIAEWTSEYILKRLYTTPDKFNSEALIDFGKSTVILKRKIGLLADIQTAANSSKDYFEIHNFLATLPYVVGSTYIELAIKTLMRSGLSLQRALHLLMVSPPQSLEDLTDPSKYALSVKKKVLYQA